MHCYANICPYLERTPYTKRGLLLLKPFIERSYIGSQYGSGGIRRASLSKRKRPEEQENNYSAYDTCSVNELEIDGDIDYDKFIGSTPVIGAL